MTFRLQLYAFVITLILVPKFAICEEVVTRSYSLPNHGSIQLKVPKSWQSKVSQPTNNLPPTIVFSSNDARSFQVLLTTLWAEKPDIVLPTPADIRKKMEQSVERIKNQSVEKDIPVKELKGLSAIGYYFSITDRTWKPDNPNDYKHMTNGMLRLGELLIAYTVLTNDGTENVNDAAVAAFETAVHIKAEKLTSGSSTESVHADAINIKEFQHDFEITVPVSKITLKLPKKGLMPQPAPGNITSNRYFYFEDKERKLIVSGWFENANRFHGVKDNPPGVLNGQTTAHQNVKFKKIGEWDAVSYEVSQGSFSNAHLSAHLVQAGTWVELHLSADPKQRSIEDQRTLLVEIVQSIQIIEKSSDEASTALIDVYLVPIDDFSYGLTDQLARKLSKDLNLNVRASLPIGARELNTLPNSNQFAAEDIIERAQDVGSRLPIKNERCVVIALTTRDINNRSQALRFVFSSNDKQNHTSVISSARMSSSTSSTKTKVEIILARIFKMAKRTIGEQYFALSRSSDINNVMYAPIMSLKDIDAMGTDYEQVSR